MAVTARDDDDPPRYFGGWEPLAKALGYVEQDESARAFVRRVVGLLVKHGLIARHGAAARTGRNAEYVLLFPGQVQLAPKGRRIGSPVGIRTDSPTGDTDRSALGARIDSPKEYEEPETGTVTGISASFSSTSPGRGVALGTNDGMDSHERDYEDARACLNSAGPEVAQEAIADVRRRFPNLSTRDAVLAAANHIRRPGAA